MDENKLTNLELDDTADKLPAPKRVERMTLTELRAVRHRDWREDIGPFRSLVIVPERRKHDSGYTVMSFVAVDERGYPIVRLGGGSDVIHIEGIAGLGKGWYEIEDKKAREAILLTQFIRSGHWAIDCLPVSRCVRLFSTAADMTCGVDVSSMEVFSEVANWTRDINKSTAARLANPPEPEPPPVRTRTVRRRTPTIEIDGSPDSQPGKK